MPATPSPRIIASEVLFILLSKFSVAFIGLICGALLLHWGDDEQSWIFFGGLAGLIVSGYWFVRAGHLARSLQKFRRKTEAANEAASDQMASSSPTETQNSPETQSKKL